MDELLSIDRDSVRVFLQRWYGFAGSVARETACMESDVPPELAEWYQTSLLTGVPVTFQDHPIDVTALVREADGMLPFWVENQHGFYWAVNPSRDDRQVFCRESGASEWRTTGESLETFLLHCAVREAIIGAEWKFTEFIEESKLQDSLQNFSRLNFVSLASEEPEATLWCGMDSLARLTLPPAGYGRPDEQIWMLTIAASNEANIQKCASRFGQQLPGENNACSTGEFDERPPF
ncbi:hypothetical protein ACIPWL_25335 [Streptomyces sp. NPDC090023]|uniref:hypothetical protein n=1 Tax=unclassified Streptomyces TaxID=2593676 RepID=UPI0037F59B43